jgi:hypothetical protein
MKIGESIKEIQEPLFKMLLSGYIFMVVKRRELSYRANCQRLGMSLLKFHLIREPRVYACLLEEYAM